MSVVFLGMTAILLGSTTAYAVVKKGEPLPEFSATTPSGQQVTNRNYSDRVLLLVFSTEYCSACKKAIPSISKLVDRYGKQEFYVLGVLSGLGMENYELKKYMNTFSVNYPMVLFDERLAKDRFGMISVPYSLLVDKKGVVAGVYYGYSDGIMKQIEGQLNKLLTE